MIIVPGAARLSITKRLIESQTEFDEFCDHVASQGLVAFDTEFVSEHTYRPVLCLVQLATREQIVAVDSLRVHNLGRLWDLVADHSTTVIVHGGREEVRFALANKGRPNKLYDVQIAEALQSRSFPLSYSSLVQRVLGQRTKGKETRTHWDRRPLTPSQLEYAYEDVAHLIEIWEKQRASLRARGRLAWAETEIERHIDDIIAEAHRENFRRVPGVTSLNARDLGVLRDLFAWREATAQRLDKPARRVLRDDLLIELARRQPSDYDQFISGRDMNRSDYRKFANEILAVIQTALKTPEAKWPEVRRNEADVEEQILAQLLRLALANRCAEVEIAMGITGTTADLRDLVRFVTVQNRQGPPPRLMDGWRDEVCGDLLTKLLAGRIAVRVGDPNSPSPLVFEPWDKSSD